MVNSCMVWVGRAIAWYGKQGMNRGGMIVGRAISIALIWHRGGHQRHGMWHNNNGVKKIVSTGSGIMAARALSAGARQPGIAKASGSVAVSALGIAVSESIAW